MAGLLPEHCLLACLSNVLAYCAFAGCSRGRTRRLVYKYILTTDQSSLLESSGQALHYTEVVVGPSTHRAIIEVMMSSFIDDAMHLRQLNRCDFWEIRKQQQNHRIWMVLILPLRRPT
jgi:hypothetical protein